MREDASRLKALIVDDEAELSSVLAMRLRASGMDVRVASDGQAGVDEARRWGPDVVLTDVSMPKLDGWELCAALRADARTARVPILVMTAWATPDLQARARAGGAAGLLLKPFDERRLAAAVRSVASARRRSAASAGRSGR